MARILLLVVALMLSTAPVALADPNNQTVAVLCRDADYADLHPLICQGPFPPSTGHGGNRGLLGGLLGGLGGLL